MSRKNSRSSGAQKRFRDNLIARADGRCEGCGEPQQNPWRMQAHHILPKADGGESVPENGLALCPKCHATADRQAAP